MLFEVYLYMSELLFSLMLITKEFTFSAAHKLPKYNGNCKNLHGHTYKLQVTLEGTPDSESGMIIDFHDLSSTVKEKVMKQLDHSYLNDTIENPTAENIVIYIWKILKPEFNNLHELKLWETETSFVTYRGD